MRHGEGAGCGRESEGLVGGEEGEEGCEMGEANGTARNGEEEEEEGKKRNTTQ